MTAPATFVTKGDGANWLSGVETDLSRGRYIDPDAGAMPLRDYAQTWMAERILRPRSAELYQGLLDHHILPTLGDTPLVGISPALIRSWHAALFKAPRPGPTTVAKAYRLLRTICGTAVEDELILRNPCNLKGASVEHSAERPVLSVRQLATLVPVVEERYQAMVLMAAWCGLRLGELLALTRADLDLLNGTVRVDKSAAELQSGVRVIGPPKTAAGRRVLSIPPHVIPALESHLATFTDPGSDALVFVGTKGQPMRRASLNTEWKRALKKARLHTVRFHDLRHTGATLAAATGASTRELMNRLGHASSQAALRYQHATAERDVAIARALSQMAMTEDDSVARLPNQI
jgi:integrase